MKLTNDEAAMILSRSEHTGHEKGTIISTKWNWQDKDKLVLREFKARVLNTMNDRYVTIIGKGLSHTRRIVTVRYSRNNVTYNGETSKVIFLSRDRLLDLKRNLVVSYSLVSGPPPKQKRQCDDSDSDSEDSFPEGVNAELIAAVDAEVQRDIKESMQSMADKIALFSKNQEDAREQIMKIMPILWGVDPLPPKEVIEEPTPKTTTTTYPSMMKVEERVHGTRKRMKSLQPQFALPGLDV